jgi:hypothetical protein
MNFTIFSNVLTVPTFFKAKKAKAAEKQGKKPKLHSHKKTRLGEEFYNAENEKEKCMYAFNTFIYK